MSYCVRQWLAPEAETASFILFLQQVAKKALSPFLSPLFLHMNELRRWLASVCLFDCLYGREEFIHSLRHGAATCIVLLMLFSLSFYLQLALPHTLPFYMCICVSVPVNEFICWLCGGHSASEVNHSSTAYRQVRSG